MQINTKYSLGDNVWVMKDNKPYTCTVFSIEPIVRRWFESINKIETIVKYRFEDQGRLFNENQLFETKEALIQSL